MRPRNSHHLCVYFLPPEAEQIGQEKRSPTCSEGEMNQERAFSEWKPGRELSQDSAWQMQSITIPACAAPDYMAQLPLAQWGWEDI